MKKQLNPALVYVLAITGLLCCCFFGFGAIPSGIAFLIAQNKIKDAEQNPDHYYGNINTMNTAKIVAMSIFIINILYLLMTIYRIYTIGWDNILEQSREMMEQWQQNS